MKVSVKYWEEDGSLELIKEQEVQPSDAILMHLKETKNN